jgi:hypothetical protein
MALNSKARLHMKSATVSVWPDVFDKKLPILDSGLPDFFGAWYQNRTKFTKWTQNVPNCHKISQMSIQYSKCPILRATPPGPDPTIFCPFCPENYQLMSTWAQFRRRRAMRIRVTYWKLTSIKNVLYLVTLAFWECNLWLNRAKIKIDYSLRVYTGSKMVIQWAWSMFFIRLLFLKTEMLLLHGILLIEWMSGFVRIILIVANVTLAYIMSAIAFQNRLLVFTLNWFVHTPSVRSFFPVVPMYIHMHSNHVQLSL